MNIEGGDICKLNIPYIVVDSTIGNVISFIPAEEDLRYEDKASLNNINLRKRASGHPYLTDLEIGTIGPYPPANKTELEASLYKAKTHVIHATRRVDLDNTASRKFHTTLSYRLSQSQAIILLVVVYFAELMQPFPRIKRYYKKYFYLVENQTVS